MTIRNELLDELLKGYQKPEDLLGESGILKQLTKALLDRCLQGEMAVTLATQRMTPRVSTAATVATAATTRP